jgi:hypothetical protein
LFGGWDLEIIREGVADFEVVVLVDDDGGQFEVLFGGDETGDGVLLLVFQMAHESNFEFVVLEQQFLVFDLYFLLFVIVQFLKYFGIYFGVDELSGCDYF